MNSELQQAKTVSMESTTAAQYSEFALFEKLPPEMRVMVWEHATDDFEPSFVTIQGYRNAAKEGGYEVAVISSRNIPALLHVNKEAKEVALKRFTPMFSAIDSKGRYNYLDISLDRVFLSGFSPRWSEKIFTQADVRADLARIKHLVIPLGYPTVRNWPTCCAYMLVDRYLSLETLTVFDAGFAFALSGLKEQVSPLLDDFWKEEMVKKQIEARYRLRNYRNLLCWMGMKSWNFIARYIIGVG